MWNNLTTVQFVMNRPAIYKPLATIPSVSHAFKDGFISMKIKHVPIVELLYLIQYFNQLQFTVKTQCN
jgi:hypothetical protein